jgi:hypothetical protein
MNQHFCPCPKLTSVSKILACFVTSLCIFSPNQIVAEAAQVDTRVVNTSIEQGVVDLSVRLPPPLDWKNEAYLSKKTFQGNGPPGFPNLGTTRHRLTWNNDGIFEWFQSDFIQIGTYQYTGDFTIEAQLFDGQLRFGVFDPVSKVLLFDGLEYVAEFPVPDVIVEVSDNLNDWAEVGQLEEVSQDFTEGYALSVRFKREIVGSEYYRVRINAWASAPVMITNELPETFQLDPFTLQNASLEGCLLTVDVSYGGGCEEHEFELFMSPSVFGESFPAQANLWLKHNANGDICRAVVSDKLEFDITAVIEQYRAQHGKDDEIILNVYGYFSDKPGAMRVVRYSP